MDLPGKTEGELIETLDFIKLRLFCHLIDHHF